MRQRLIGGGLFLAGVAFACFCVYEPLAAAADQAPSISLSLDGSILCPILLVFGLLYLIMGERAEELVGSWEDPKPVLWMFLGVTLLLAGFGLFFWVKSTLKQAGYS